jgi:hypothetical protein
MPSDEELRNGPTPEQRARLAVNADWTVNVTDERNARYLIPLGGMIQCGAAGQVRAEDMAEEMASAVYGAIVTDATPEITAEAVYFQALVDARRMVCDPEYLRLFEGGPDRRREPVRP